MVVGFLSGAAGLWKRRCSWLLVGRSECPEAAGNRALTMAAGEQTGTDPEQVEPWQAAGERWCRSGPQPHVVWQAWGGFVPGSGLAEGVSVLVVPLTPWEPYG